MQRHAQAFQIHDMHRIRTSFHSEQLDVLEAKRDEQMQFVEQSQILDPLRESRVEKSQMIVGRFIA
ncbi:hypothetical protein PA15_0329945 [Pseudomonas aeruginosa HB15]|nr:hypothetical protein PA15_0329945 [Pseudomonas aeruginosa HB15]